MRKELPFFLSVSLGLAVCGGASGGDPQDPEPGNVCAEQRTATTPDGHEVIVCERLFDKAPFLRLPPPPEGTSFGGLDGQGLTSIDGQKVPLDLTRYQQDEEAIRHSLAIYRFDLRE